MSGEAQMQVSLQITKDDTAGILNYRSYPTQFTADVSGALGPTPGAFIASITGTDVDLTQLTVPGLCKITNQDDTNYVTYGIHEESTNQFYPLGEVLAGEFYIFRLSRWLGLEWAEPGTGTGTALGSNNKLMIRASTAPVVVLVEAFEA